MHRYLELPVHNFCHFLGFRIGFHILSPLQAAWLLGCSVLGDKFTIYLYLTHLKYFYLYIYIFLFIFLYMY